MSDEEELPQGTATILLVDDNPADLLVVCKQFKRAGYRVVVAREAEEAIERAGFVQPDLILLDVVMPESSGFEICRRLKATASTQDIPVIFMTALTDVSDKVTAFEAGGVDYITKPFQVGEVLARVNTQLSLRAMQQLLNARNQQLQEQLSEQRLQREELEYRATHDMLTELPNRTLFMDRLTHAIERARRNQSQLAVLFIDLDKFKIINDTLGHGAGDELLQSVAERLRNCARKSDTLGRLGGDEFVVLAENTSAVADIETLIERLSSKLVEPVLLAGLMHSVTCSIGISRYPRDGETAETLLKHADLAMFQAKDRGRNAYRFFEASMQETLNRRVSLERQLREAFKRDEFVLYYQPQIDLRNGRICSLEALVRWQSPNDGLVLPGHFVPLAEESRLILALGEWVLRSACIQLRRWLNRGVPFVPVAINLAAAQFADPTLDQLLKGALVESELDARYLELELTESMSMSDPEVSLAMMHRLKEIGVSLAIDDFGTGFSNLSYVRRFPVDKLKIDRTFVEGMISNPQDNSIVLSVIRLAHSLGLRAVAEGVETEGQVRLLAEGGCDMFQGHQFRPALAAPDIEDLLQRQVCVSPELLARPFQLRTVLLVEDEPQVANSFRRMVRNHDIHVIAVEGPTEAYEVLAQQDIGVVVSDYRMPREDGIQFLSNVKRLYPNSIRILMTGHVDRGTLENTINQAEAFRFIAKPWYSDQVIATLEQAFQRYDYLSRAGGVQRIVGDVTMGGGGVDEQR
ncbi:EAL domain-containing protein [Marinobacter sp. CA1]|uniref:EAL domain-containing protein n=1 Tax=Marinobacter sp. CA1 TaxID=2817656 RepID=UPI001D09063E|nr:EAL domain-containing protein [Marinobacter sp. CA1]UDL03959.1 EAL domain-containing protein [Marinobacter sp. CA1]